MRGSVKKLSPWFWVPTLYFAEGIPYFVVNSISVIMFNRMGMPNGEMALLTSLLYLPWVVKPLWSSFVDVTSTKRWWVTAMQILISLCFILVALTVPSRTYSLILILFWITAFASATHDIAADGFYMLALSESEQSFFVGVRSTF
ncbi:MAG: MFS transporter, partial [Candidatus Cryptobacteroides sp.]